MTPKTESGRALQARSGWAPATTEDVVAIEQEAASKAVAEVLPALANMAHQIHEMAVSIGEEGYSTLHRGAFVECPHPICIANRATLDAALIASERGT